jgi:heme-degrading monooxygenase HmoA
MFVAIYRWKVKPGMEEQFREGWRRITLLARERGGA